MDQQPWLTKKNWAEGRIVSGHVAGALFPWIFALAFGGIGTTVMIAAWDDVSAEGVGPFLFLAIFPAIGFLMTIWAIQSTLTYFKYGRSVLRLETLPGVVGGWFRARLETRLRVDPADKVVARLSCVHRHVSGTGKNQTVHRNVQWQEEAVIPAEAIGRTREGLSQVPVAFYVPYECQETTLADSNDRHLWELDISAEVPGIDYHASFEVPVFRTEESVVELPPEVAAQYTTTYEEALHFEKQSPIRVGQAMGGGVEIYVPPFRNKGIAGGLVIFFLIWGAVVAGIYLAGAPFFFVLIFGAVLPIILWGLVETLFGSRRTVIGPESVVIRKSVLGIRSVREVALDQIAKVDMKISVSAGSRLFYDVFIEEIGGKKRTVASVIPNKDEARWVADTVRGAAGIGHS